LFDLPAPAKHFKVTATIYICRGTVVQCLVIPMGVVIIHKYADLIPKLRVNLTNIIFSERRAFSNKEKTKVAEDRLKSFV
jgi:hypothetical protein